MAIRSAVSGKNLVITFFVSLSMPSGIISTICEIAGWQKIVRSDHMNKGMPPKSMNCLGREFFV